MDTDNNEKTPETAENQPRQETPASGQGAIAASSRGALIRKTRLAREKPLSCAELAGLIGVSTATMSLIERDKCPVNDVRLAKIAKVLSLPFDVLKNGKGAEISSLTAWQQHLQEMYTLNNEELATLLQIAIDAKLYRFDEPDTRSLPQWEQFYEEMRNFLPRMTLQDRMLQNKTALTLIGQQENESAEEAFRRYLTEIDMLVESIARSINHNFNNAFKDPFSDLYLAAICKAYRIKVITIENTTNTEVVKQQLFSLNVPEAIGSFIALSENQFQYTAAHTVDNAPDGIQRHLILQDRRKEKGTDSGHRLWRAITQVILGMERMNQIASFVRADSEAVDWFFEKTTLRIEFPPSVLTRLFDIKMSPQAKENPFSWMDGLQSMYAPKLPESRVFGEFTRQMPFPLCYFGASFQSENISPPTLKIDYFYASQEAAERGLFLSGEIPLKSLRNLFLKFAHHFSDEVVNEAIVFDSALVADLGLPESFIGTPTRIAIRNGIFDKTVTVFLVPDFTNTPTKDPYADW